MKRKLRIRIYLTAVVIILGAAFGLLRIVPSLRPPYLAHYFLNALPKEAFVKKVVDGDTIELLDGSMVRYIGIDTPEMSFKRADKWEHKPQRYAVEATLLNQKLVEGKKVRFEYDTVKKDRYRRILAYVYADNLFINGEMVKQGYAYTFNFPPNVRYAEVFAQYQDEAQKNCRGIWSNKDQIISSDEAYRYIGAIKTIKGKIMRVTKTPKVIYLNFGADYKKDFTIVIFKRNFKEFAKLSNDLAGVYQNKTVSITGKIKEYNGPEIIAHSPADIRILEK